MTQIVTLGIDVGKSTFHVVGTTHTGKPVFRQQFSRAKLAEFVATHSRCVIGMEACAGSQHLARQFERDGHDVRLMAAHFVKPYVKTNKNDFNDALAIAEAVRRPTMRYVPIKTIEQHDQQALHRVRQQLMKTRTSVINEIRAFLLERGITVRTSPTALSKALPTILADDESTLSRRLRALLGLLQRQWRYLDDEVRTITREIEQIARERDDCRRLQTIPGIGTLTSTALVAAIGKGEQFTRARDVSAWLGVVPRQHSTGGRTRLLGISKRGNRYVRSLLIHGARSCYYNLCREDHRLGVWLNDLEARGLHPNVIITALANKLARLSWAVLRSGEEYDPGRA